MPYWRPALLWSKAVLFSRTVQTCLALLAFQGKDYSKLRNAQDSAQEKAQG